MDGIPDTPVITGAMIFFVLAASLMVGVYFKHYKPSPKKDVEERYGPGKLKNSTFSNTSWHLV